MNLLWFSVAAFIGGMLIGLAPIIPKWLEYRRTKRQTRKIIEEMEKHRMTPSQAWRALWELEN